MKKLFAGISIIFILVLFGYYLHMKNNTNEVLKIYTPTKLGIDTNNNKILESNETYCISGINSFSLNNKNDIKIDNYNLSELDYINLGYLADEFAKKTLQNQKVKIKLTKHQTSECQYINLYLRDVDYKEILNNSGFAVISSKITNNKNFKTNLEASKKLNLVIYNHKSNKYHKLNCEYAQIAHDKIYIPLKQLPKEANPCKFCHDNNLNKKNKTKSLSGQNFNNTNYTTPAQTTLYAPKIKIYIMDFTHTLKPNGNCSTSACKSLIENINNAKNTIDIAIYGYENNTAVTNALKKAKERGVYIRFVYDEVINPANLFYHSNDIISEIANESKGDNTGKEVEKLMHNKFVIFDKQIVYTGSMNFSNTGFSGFDGNDIAIIESEEIAQLYTQEFEQMINGRFHSSKVQNAGKHSFNIEESKIEVYFSPKYRTTARIIQIINRAEKYIYIPTFLITHKKITEALINAHDRGVDVKIIMDAANVATMHIKYQEIRNKGIPLKIENYAGKLHSKTMLIDDEYLIMGSMNFSNSGDINNDENTLIIKNQILTRNYRNYFNYLWNIIPDKYLKFNPPAESKESIGSCSDGVDNNFNGKIDLQEEKCK